MGPPLGLSCSTQLSAIRLQRRTLGLSAPCSPLHWQHRPKPVGALHAKSKEARHGLKDWGQTSTSQESALATVEAVVDYEQPVELLESWSGLVEGSQQDSDEGSFVEDEEELDQDFWSDQQERVYLVGVSLKSKQKKYTYSIEETMEELARLADTAGLKVVGQTHQVLEAPNMSTYIGSGKVAQVARAVKAYKAETVIFDDELSPGQLRNLERALGGEEGNVKVCDRTALILDIFSQRAATREGMLQVELAQTEYQLPRLTRMWTHLDRVGGGGQVKGAGEKQIEIDKRLLRDRMAVLRKDLESVRTHRRQYRERRSNTPIPVVAIVGYTNAGKSTLLNTLTQAGVLAEDKLFATLDPTTRKIRLKGNKELLMSDTVGFIQKLPTQLVAAFRATLEEIQDATVLLHLVDISHPNAAGQCSAVLNVLDDIDVGNIPMITAWNKVDACADPEQVRSIAAQRPDTICVSGLTGEGIPELLELIGSRLEASMIEVEALLPFSAGVLMDEIHKIGRVKSTDYSEHGTLVKALVPASLAGKLREYFTQPVDVPERKRAKKFLEEFDGFSKLGSSAGAGSFDQDWVDVDA